MEKPNSFMNSGGYGIGFQENGLNNSSSDQLQNMFYNNPTWENSMDQNDPFGSALSSMVSSPTTTPNVVVVPGNDNFVLREFIGRLGGGISNSGEISTNTSCYNTPLNSPPKLKLSVMDHQIRENLHFHGGNGNHLPTHPSLSQFSSDPGFADRAARFSTVSNSQSMKVSGSQLGGVQELKHVSSLHHGNPATDQIFNGISRSLTPENYEIGNSRENSSVSEQISLGEIGKNGQKDANSRKRKAVQKGKAKETTTKDTNVPPENNESHVKRSKSDENNGSDKANGTDKAAGDGNQKQNKDNNQKPPEAPKDYIHVRARSGQATDAHSLAERVRREKIGERMKLLQDLVPGCNKVTGKAVMLDEIINYVQSLQRQVEFLSMKLSTVNPRMDFNMESLLSKDIFQSRGSLHQNMHPSEASAQAFPYGFQSQSGQNLQSALPKGSDVLFSLNPFNPNMARNVSTFFEDDLNGVVQMGFNQI